MLRKHSNGIFYIATTRIYLSLILYIYTAYTRAARKPGQQESRDSKKAGTRINAKKRCNVPSLHTLSYSQRSDRDR